MTNLTDALASEKAQVAVTQSELVDVSVNITTCNGKLEQRWLVQVAQTAADLANDQPADVDVDVPLRVLPQVQSQAALQLLW